MSEEENKKENGLSHSGDSPREVARQVRGVILRSGVYLSHDRFTGGSSIRSLEANESNRINNAIVRETVRRNVRGNRRGRRELNIDKDSSGLYWFTYSDELEEEMIDLPKKDCYLCGCGLDNLYCYVINSLGDLIPDNFINICCSCSRIIEDPSIVKRISWREDTPYIVFSSGNSPYTSDTYIGVIALIRYLKVIDQQKADAVRSKLRELGFPIDSNVFKVFMNRMVY